ncbi:hypothetical protein H0H81_003727 [Sphagnurus paluster]|uniref:Aminopeptidase P N-terminal domain-containing protein n=1 Tax=Sphagnurus paluster TaxID=117069 RepID=A0A9P7K689_9AGAR|nr:hypothetical protein H0H81_003727 [Sphagnurus paluster]
MYPDLDVPQPQVILAAGGTVEFRNDTDRELVFRQESNFFYLTGCNVPGSFVLAVYQPGQTPSIDLFVPEAVEADIMWSVPPPSLDAAAASHDVTHVKHPATIPSLLAALPPGALVHTLARGSPLFPAIPDDHLAPLLVHDSITPTDAYLLTALHNARLIKDEHEISLIRKANEISSRAHETVMRVLGQAVKHGLRAGAAREGRPLLPGEWLIEKEAAAEAIFVASCRREGAVHQAYLPIVASSTRASTLHYCCNDREFAWGPVGPHDHQSSTSPLSLSPQVLLIDAGCEWDNYAADITRTTPVGNGGKFTPESRAIYTLVLAMQSASFALCKPGTHWDAVQRVCHTTLIAGFKDLGIFRTGASEAELLASGISAAFFPHGVGHSLGMDVHDVPSVSKPVDVTTGALQVIGDGALAGDKAEWGHASCYEYLRLRRPLEAGMVVTVEPGIYFSPHLLARAGVHNSAFLDVEVLRKYEGMGGVRIEDVVVITMEGYENLTTVRSDVEWVEGVSSGEI